MGKRKGAIPSDRKQCSGCKEWKNYSYFDAFKHGDRVDLDHMCKACRQFERVQDKNVDRARYIIESRAGNWARKLGCTRTFLMEEMNWESLVEVFRGLPERGKCQNCGHPFDAEHDVQIEHHLPPRHQQDWARHHARNLGFMCSGSNNTKNDKDYADWLDEQEACRLSNERRRQEQPIVQGDIEQLELGLTVTSTL